MTTRDLWNQINLETPTPDQSWINKSKSERKILINLILVKLKINEFLLVEKCQDDGFIFFEIISPLNSNVRGELLLNLERNLKSELDKGLTVWISPQDDKNSLRKLRGVEVKII